MSYVANPCTQSPGPVIFSSGASISFCILKSGVVPGFSCCTSVVEISFLILGRLLGSGYYGYFGFWPEVPATLFMHPFF